MINGSEKILAIIPARGGSKGVPRKNIRELGGKPMLAWTIEAAKKSKYLDRVVLSSEDEEIMVLAKKLGCDVPFKRPAELSSDETPGIEPVLHALEECKGYDWVVLLQPTSPLRLASDIDEAIELCMKRKSNVCISVAETDKSPFWMFTKDDASSGLKLLLETKDFKQTRQELPKTYAVNGAVYVARAEWLRKTRKFVTPETVGYVMPKDRSIDIDTDLDWILAEQLLLRRK